MGSQACSGETVPKGIPATPEAKMAASSSAALPLLLASLTPGMESWSSAPRTCATWARFGSPNCAARAGSRAAITLSGFRKTFGVSTAKGPTKPSVLVW